jgi:hypothetical protein
MKPLISPSAIRLMASVPTRIGEGRSVEPSDRPVADRTGRLARLVRLLARRSHRIDVGEELASEG